MVEPLQRVPAPAETPSVVGRGHAEQQRGRNAVRGRGQACQPG